MRLKKYKGLLAGLVAGVLLTGIAHAAIPDSSGVIHGCRNNNNGSIRVIDSATQTCSGNETALNWSQTGPVGPQGPAGPQSLAFTIIDSSSATPSQVTPGGRSNFAISCAGGVAISGGFFVEEIGDASSYPELSLVVTGPVAEASHWSVTVENSGTETASFNVYAFCTPGSVS